VVAKELLITEADLNASTVVSSELYNFIWRTVHMEQLSLYSALDAKLPSILAFYGAGGKTTLMLRLAAELATFGHKIVLTTTTKIYPPEGLPLQFFSSVDETNYSIATLFAEHDIVVLGRQLLPDGKIDGLNPVDICKLFELLKVTVLVEADGAKGKPIKGYNDYEPVLPECTSLSVVVIGADAINKELNDCCVHRLDKLLAAVDSKAGELIDRNIIAKIYRDLLYRGKAQAPFASQVCILNKADLHRNIGPVSLEIANLLKGIANLKSFIVTSAQKSDPVRIRIKKNADNYEIAVSAVLLAAGTSSRMGCDKLSLYLDGKTVFEHVLNALSETLFEDLIVVTNPGSSLQQIALRYNCTVVENRNYQAGLSTSLKCGLNAVSSNAQGVLFALADQPLLSPGLCRKLLESYRKHLKLITCPIYQGHRGNPIIFDRRTWSDLLQIKGDQGGKALFDSIEKDQTDRVAVDDQAVLVDLDTPEDYLHLRNVFKDINKT
jgi:molybdenum cofactor cytidylyltransferase